MRNLKTAFGRLCQAEEYIGKGKYTAAHILLQVPPQPNEHGPDGQHLYEALRDLAAHAVENNWEKK